MLVYQRVGTYQTPLPSTEAPHSLWISFFEPLSSPRWGVFLFFHGFWMSCIYPQTGTFADPETDPFRAFVPFLPGRVLAFGLFFFAFFVASRASVHT